MADSSLTAGSSEGHSPPRHLKSQDHQTTQKLNADAQPGTSPIHVLKPDIPLHQEADMQPHADALTQKLFRDVAPAVVKIRTPDGAGSGFFFDKNGDIATDAHVVIGDEQVDVETADGKIYPARVTHMDDLRDVAILQIDGGTPANINVPKLGTDEDLEPDDKLWALGHPQGLDPIYISPGYYRTDTTPMHELASEGSEELLKTKEYLADLTPQEQDDAHAYLERDLDQGKIHVEPGNSGGPVVDKDGNVVGLTDMTDTTASTDVTPVGYLKDLMNEKTPKFTFAYKFLTSDKVKHKVAANGEYILTDVSRSDGTYRPPYDNPLFDADDQSLGRTPPASVPNLERYVPKAVNQ